MKVAAELHGSQTELAAANFDLTGSAFSADRHFVEALAAIKSAAAATNADLGVIDREVADAIAAAADEMKLGQLDHLLVVDEMEGSGGTSTNMNVNEALAVRATQIVSERGHVGRVHAHDAVNRSQSTNDVIPSAIKMACHSRLSKCVPALERLAAGFGAKAQEFADDLKLGRTCLQDAQPMTVGNAFGAYQAVVARHASKLASLQEDYLVLPLGATAIGTGFGAPPAYRQMVIGRLAAQTRTAWRSASDPFDALANADAFTRLSSELRSTAASIAKIGNDLQFLSSGPAGGVGEVHLPVVQAGSSIMPGKVNPVMAMSVCQIGFVIAGYDLIVHQACQQGQLEINPYEPVIGTFLLKALRLIERGADLFEARCIKMLSIDRERCLANLLASSAVATAFAERFGYERASALVRQAAEANISFAKFIEQQGVATDEDMSQLLYQAAGQPSGGPGKAG